jgi:hypothetical protein
MSDLIFSMKIQKPPLGGSTIILPKPLAQASVIKAQNFVTLSFYQEEAATPYRKQ